MKSENAKFTTNILEGVRNDFDDVNMYITIKFPVNDIIPKTVIMKPIIPNHRGSIGGHLYQYGSTICIISDGTLSAKLTFRPPPNQAFCRAITKKTTIDLDEDETCRSISQSFAPSEVCKEDYPTLKPVASGVSMGFHLMRRTMSPVADNSRTMVSAGLHDVFPFEKNITNALP
uniref:Uncharacterized protein n=1 Tax=Glossina pallidipes TaxID=7398 RepID=A0A1A9ZHP0_GLOPL